MEKFNSKKNRVDAIIQITKDSKFEIRIGNGKRQEAGEEGI